MVERMDGWTMGAFEGCGMVVFEMAPVESVSFAVAAIGYLCTCIRGR